MSGGGGSGDSYPPNPNHIIQYAPYVEAAHQLWLNQLSESFNLIYLDSPYTSAFAYNPDADIDAMLAALNAFITATLAFHDTEVDINAVSSAFADAKTVKAFDPLTTWQSNVSSVKSTLDNTMMDSTQISASVSTFSSLVHQEVTEKAIPQFEAGMRDINAVISSAFVVGNALIASEETRQVAKFTSDLMLAQWSDRNKSMSSISVAVLDAQFKKYQAYMVLAETLGKFFIQGIEYKRVITQVFVDSLRMKIVAKKEQTDENLRIDVANKKWRLELTQYASSLIGSAGGGHAVPQGTGERSTGSTAMSVLGGVMAGASIGTMFNDTVGGNWGTIGGGVVGGVLGAIS